MIILDIMKAWTSNVFIRNLYKRGWSIIYIPDLIYAVLILVMILLIISDKKSKQFGDNKKTRRNIEILTALGTLLFYDILYHLFSLQITNPISFKKDGFDISLIGVILYIITAGIIIKAAESRIKNGTSH